MYDARLSLHKLINEEELRQAKLILLFNIKAKNKKQIGENQ